MFIGNGQSQTVVQNSNNVILNYDADDSGAGTFDIRSGGASVLSANNAGNVTVANTMTINGINNGNDGITNAGAISGVTNLTTNGDTILGDASGDTTTVNGTFNANSGTGNTLTVGASQSTTVGGNTVNYGTEVEGGMLVNGDLGVNGNIYSLNSNANVGVGVANNGLEIEGSSNTVSLVSDDNANAADGRAQVTLTPDTAAVTVTNASGNTHGLNVGTTETTLSGGANSTTLTLNDDGATFTNTDTGGPARVMGVADGINDFDAVNMRQFRQLSNEVEETQGGVASVAAMANIPQVSPGQKFALGLGYGNFSGESAVAAGGSARVNENIVAKASLGYSSGNATVGGGVAYGW